MASRSQYHLKIIVLRRNVKINYACTRLRALCDRLFPSLKKIHFDLSSTFNVIYLHLTIRVEHAIILAQVQKNCTDSSLYLINPFSGVFRICNVQSFNLFLYQYLFFVWRVKGQDKKGDDSSDTDVEQS